MKNLILSFIFIIAGALIFSVTDGYSHSSYTDCNTVTDCTKCHNWSFCEICPSDPTCDTSSTSTCREYFIRRACNRDLRCEWDRTSGCQDYVDPSINTDEDSCFANGGRWNKKKAICR